VPLPRHLESSKSKTQPVLTMEAVKDAVQDAAEGVKNLAVSKDQKPKKEKKKKGGEAADGRPLELKPAPAYIDHRIQIL
jgi:threonyl-tRNA synthetase